MGLLSGLIRASALIGAGVAATKISERVKENNPDGVGKDVYANEFGKAAKELYAENAPKVKEVAQEKVGGKIEEFKQANPEVSAKVAEAVGFAKAKAEEVKAAIDKAAQGAQAEDADVVDCEEAAEPAEIEVEITEEKE